MIVKKRNNTVLGCKAESNSEVNCQVLSNAAIRDELSFQLSSKLTSQVMNDNAIMISHKYHERAECVLHRISIWAIPPVFIINTSDLSQQLHEGLDQ